MPKAITIVESARTAALSLLVFGSSVAAQDRLKAMPGYERYQRMAPLIRTAVAPAPLTAAGGGVSWSPDGQSVEYSDAGKRYRFDIGAKKIETGNGAQRENDGGNIASVVEVKS